MYKVLILGGSGLIGKAIINEMNKSREGSLLTNGITFIIHNF